ncbi:MAG: hypothetical protein LKJ86_03715 [Oscillibacter sp.]|jgi:hypothetical protein|nr:hypothetical protein [Oscillibacter sp.]
MNDKKMMPEARQTAEKVEGICNRMGGICRRIIQRNDAEGPDFYGDAKRLRGLLIDLYMVYLALIRYACLCLLDGENLTKLLAELPLEERQNVEVRAVVLHGMLLIKLPLFPSRFQAKEGKKAQHYKWFCRELSEALEQIAQQIPEFRKRQFSYLFVISSGGKCVCDSDNYDVKGITDTVAHYFPGGDSPLFTSFFYCSVDKKEYDLPEGTYLTVYDQFDNSLSLDRQIFLCGEVFSCAKPTSD